MYHAISVPVGFRLGDSEGPSEQVTPSAAAPPPEVSNIILCVLLWLRITLGLVLFEYLLKTDYIECSHTSVLVS